MKKKNLDPLVILLLGHIQISYHLPEAALSRRRKKPLFL